MSYIEESLNGKWKFTKVCEDEKPHWLPGIVPGHVHLDLMQEGIIPDPFERCYEKGVSWVDESQWAYERHFDINEFQIQEAKHILRFEGLDTVADIFLNSKHIASTDNMFMVYEFDVTDLVRPSGNVIRVEFAPADQVGESRKLKYIQETNENLGYNRSFIRKAQYMFGWDWGPTLISCGIWRDVKLISYSSTRILDWDYESIFNDNRSCSVKIGIDLEVLKPMGGKVEVELSSPKGDIVKAHKDTTLSAGSNRIELQVQIEEPSLWWPNGVGPQNLYDLSISVTDEYGTEVSTGGKIGLREVKLKTKDDEGGECFVFEINGRPIFCKGANWIPADFFSARVTREKYEELLQMAKDANMNMIRIWGGGIYESPDFYETCDRLGLMVWQDFMYACAYYPDTGEYAEATREEGRQVVKRLKKYPCIVLWCGNNENYMMHVGRWSSTPPSRHVGERIYEQIIPEVIRELDPTRPYWPSSPYGGDEPNGELSGDRHNWRVWHRSGDWRLYNEDTGKFLSEFGYLAPPALETLQRFIPLEELYIDSRVLWWHNKSGKTPETFLSYIEGFFPKIADVDDLIYYGQINQLEALRCGIGHWRRLKFHCGGTLFWQLNDCWPVLSWSVIDCDLRPKAGYYGVKDLYSDILIHFEEIGDGKVGIWVINDADLPLKGILNLEIIDFYGEVLWKSDQEINVPPDSSSQVATLSQQDMDSQRSLLLGRLKGITQNVFFFVKPDELDLPRPELMFQIIKRGEKVSLEVEAKTFAPWIYLSLPNGIFSDNFFTLLPGQRKTIEIHGGKDLSLGYARVGRYKVKWVNDSL